MGGEILMGIEQLQNYDISEVVSLWNEEQANGAFIHAQLTEEKFKLLFLEGKKPLIKLNYLYKHENQIIGFANGCYNEGLETGYITFVLVKSEFKRQGIGTLLLKEIETQLKGVNGLKEIDLIFLNPINLSWIVPGTTNHTHPNAPGVDVKSDGYIFFKNNGYRDIVYQNSYYRLLKDFDYTEIIYERLYKLNEKNIHITYYDPTKHHGWDELFEDFNNPLWTQTIYENINREDGGDPILIVEHEGKICGFTGPLSVEASKRGYFCGIGVHSDYRQHGAGKVLFSALCKGLKDIGADYMTLFTGENNQARNIYESANFKIVRTWADMRKELK